MSRDRTLERRLGRGACRRSRNAACAGFTLLEVLVSLVVLGFLMAGLAQGVQFGVRAWNTQAGSVGRNADLDAADRVLRLLLARMNPPSEPDRPSVQGHPTSLQFVAELPVGAPIDPPRTAAITLLVDTSHRLILRWVPQPHAQLLAPPLPARDEVLLSGVSELDMSYRAASGIWTTAWTAPVLPQLVRIHLTFAGHRRWPDILVAPMRDSISETGD